AEPSVERRHVEGREAVVPEPPDVGLEEASDVGDAVLQHRKPIYPASEGESLVALGIDAAHLEHAGMYLARAAELEPVIAGAVLDLTRDGPVTAQIPLDAWFGERKEARARAQLDLVDLEERLAELLDRPAQMPEMKTFVDRKDLELVEHR